MGFELPLLAVKSATVPELALAAAEATESPGESALDVLMKAANSATLNGFESSGRS